MTVEGIGTVIIVASGGASASLAAVAFYTPRMLRDTAERVGEILIGSIAPAADPSDAEFIAALERVAATPEK